MDIQHNSGETKGQFFVEIEGEVKAIITYSKMGKTGIIIDHTDVNDDLRGMNMGKTLVEHVVRHARKNELKVIPLCPYAKSVIDKDPSLQDVLRG